MKGSHEALAGLRSQSSSAAGTVTDRRDADRGAGHRTGDSLARAVRDKVGATTPLTIYDTLTNARLKIPVMSDEKIKWFLMSGKEAMDPENILKLFEKLKGRPATSEERAELSKRKILPGKHGIPHLGPVGTGFGITDATAKGPKKPS